RNDISNAYRSERNSSIARLSASAGDQGIALRERLGTVNKMFSLASQLQKPATRILGKDEIKHLIPTVGHAGFGGFLGRELAGPALGAAFGLPGQIAATVGGMIGGLAWKSFRNYMNNGGWVKGVRAMQGLG